MLPCPTHFFYILINGHTIVDLAANLMMLCLASRSDRLQLCIDWLTQKYQTSQLATRFTTFELEKARDKKFFI